MEKIYQVKVFGLSDEMKIIDLCSTEEEMKRFTVRQLREKILQKFGIKLGSGELRLIFTSQTLDDDSALLSSYGIQHMSVIHLVVSVPGGWEPEKGDGGMGDKEGKNRSMERQLELQHHSCEPPPTSQVTVYTHICPDSIYLLHQAV
uniref:Ubiquitin-like domain-containing protein n=1 Tax=Anabas testudineus TaxID=64144 RepID=A0AAQ6IQV9_ANATE